MEVQNKVSGVLPEIIKVSNSKNKKSPKWMLVIFVIIGLGFVASSVFMYQSQKEFLAIAKSTVGIVIDLEKRSSDDGYTYAPVVQYSRPDNEEKLVFTSNTSSKPPAYDVGEEVDVLYDPDSDKAKIDGFFSLWGGVIIMLPIGIIFALIGIMGLRSSKKFITPVRGAQNTRRQMGSSKQKRPKTF